MYTYIFFVDELTQIENHKLHIHREYVDHRNIIQGYRIVELGYTLNWALCLQDHKNICSLGVLQLLIKETTLALVSTLIFQCNLRKRTVKHTTEDPNNPRIKSAVVWGTISSRSTYLNTEELMSVLNVPMMSHTTFIRQERELGQTWDEILRMEIMKYGIFI